MTVRLQSTAGYDPDSRIATAPVIGPASGVSGRELDRIELTSNAAFSPWLYGWKRRWLAGARARVLVANDGSHAIAVADPYARRPPLPRPDVQLALFE